MCVCVCVCVCEHSSQFGEFVGTGGEGIGSSSPSEERQTLSSSLTYCGIKEKVSTHIHVYTPTYT